MLILAMESSAKPASVAICELPGGYDQGFTKIRLLGQYFQNNGLTHSRTLLAMTESLLVNLDTAVDDIDLIAVSSGPGSFTGVRIGVSAAKGFAWGADIPVCGVSTLEAMAYQTSGLDAVSRASSPESGSKCVICPVMDARRNQVYNAFFEWSETKLVRLSEDRAISLDDLSVELRSIKNPCLLIGDGVTVSYDYLTSKGISCEAAPELLRYQTAYGVALAALSIKPVPAIELEPGYLRPSQAERELSHSSSKPSS